MSAVMTPRAKVLLPLFLLLLFGAGYYRLGREAGGERGPLTFGGRSMGTTYKVLVSGVREPRLAALSRAARGELDRVEALMSTYRPDSEVSRFNASKETGASFPISVDTRRVIEAAQRVSEESGGAFDITVRPLVGLWGFGAGAKVDRPSEEQVERARARVGYRQLELTEAGLGKRLAELEIDLSAIAKGYAVDRVVEVLVDSGVEACLVEVGGEVRIRGEKQPGVPWRIGIEQPTEGGERVAREVVQLRRGAIATSGDYRNFYEEGGVRRSHTIDPRTGKPVVHALASVSVAHELTMLADAYATALSVLGPSEGYRFAVEHGLAAQFLVRGPNGEFTARSTPEFAQLFSKD